MPPLYLTHQGGYYVWTGDITTKELPKKAGFTWTRLVERRWATEDTLVAMRLREYADDRAERIIQGKLMVIEMSRQGRPSLDAPEYPCPDGLQYRPYQRVGIQYALAHPHCIIADEMGLGKTVMAIGVANALEARSILVVCPASLRLNWRNEFFKWDTTPFRGIRYYNIVTSGIDKVSNQGHCLTIVNYDLLTQGIYEQLIEMRFDLIILDEAHYCKNPKAKRTKVVLGKPDGIAYRGDRVLALTGTPITNRPVELWPLVSSLAPDQFPRFIEYGIRYCAGHQKKIPGRQPKLVWDFTGASNLGELQLKLRASLMIRRLKADVLEELPPKIRRIVPLPSEEYSDLIDEELDAYAVYQSDIEWAEEEVERARAAGDETAYREAVERLRYAQRVAFTAMSRVRLSIACAKLEPGTQYILEALEETDKVIVFAHHRDLIRCISQALVVAHIEHAAITGDTPLAVRQSMVEAFQNDPNCRVFLGNIQAAGVGITLTAASRVIFLELSPVPADMSQAEDRVHRIGQKESVLVEHLVFDGSLDARFAQLLIEKQAVLDAALDDVVGR
jgi:SWI/SNF-related matrix-associated actin-dependent regulator 1 of chromatin subfamily A